MRKLRTVEAQGLLDVAARLEESGGRRAALCHQQDGDAPPPPVDAGDDLADIGVSAHKGRQHHRGCAAVDRVVGPQQ